MTSSASFTQVRLVLTSLTIFHAFVLTARLIVYRTLVLFMINSFIIRIGDWSPYITPVAATSFALAEALDDTLPQFVCSIDSDFTEGIYRTASHLLIFAIHISMLDYLLKTILVSVHRHLPASPCQRRFDRRLSCSRIRCAALLHNINVYCLLGANCFINAVFQCKYGIIPEINNFVSLWHSVWYFSMWYR